MSQKRRIKRTGRKPAKRYAVKTKPLKKKPIKKKVKKVTEQPKSPIETGVTTDMPLPDALRLWLQANVELINITGWERTAGMPKTCLRQISSGKRLLNREQLKVVTEKILPELKIIVGILSNYDKAVFWEGRTP